MILYLLKSGLCLAFLLVFYHLVLEREKMHQFNRFYLLGSVIFSFLAPSFIIYVEAKNAIQATLGYTEKVEVTNLSFFDEYVTLQNTLITLYLLVSVIFLARFINNLVHIIKKIKVNEVIKGDNAKFVPVTDEILPHTFWDYIFINKEDYSNQKIEKELFTHELAHVTQRHTIDVLILETLQILFWFNPLFFLLKKAVQLNHEFLADDKVISSHDNISRYQTLLLSKASWKNEYYLASNLNYSLTKKRLLMMKTQNSKKTILLKKMIVLPFLAGLAFLFANRVEAQTKKKNPPPKPVRIEVVEKGITDTQMKEYKDFMKGVNKNSVLKMKDVKRLGYLYRIMSKKQQRSVKNIYKLLPPPPPPRKVKEIKNEKGEVIRPVRIEVVEKSKKKSKKKLPPLPPRKKKVKVIEIKENGKHLKEIHEIEEVHEVEEEVEVEEIEEEHEKLTEVLIHEEEIELVKELEEKHLEEIEAVHEQEIEHLKKSHLPDYDKLKKEGYTFYLNGKKISAKRAKRINSNDMKKIDIVKGVNDAGKIYIYTK